MWIKCTLSVLVLTLLAGVRSSTSPLVNANNDFSMRLYKRVAGVIDDQNTILSPFSVSTAMAMTLAGARLNTADEMNKVLGFAEHHVTNVSGDFLSVLDKLKSSNNDNCTLVLANRLFPAKKFKLISQFVDLVTKKYSATPESLDFAEAADESRRYINNWAADATEQKIKNLLSSGDISPQTVLVLANAIYFKASWRTPFDKSKSTRGPFYISSDLTANITMMQTTGKFRFRIDNDLKCQFVEMPYGGTSLAMILVVPQDKDGLLALESSLTGSVLSKAIDSMHEMTVKVKMPKFNITQRIDLAQTLSNMGIHDLFKPGSANLSGLAEDPAGLAVSGVVHKAFISVNEEGTEAAAATAVIVNRARPLEVVADRPFMFLIRDGQTGSIVFMGRLIQPPADDDTDNSPNTAGQASPVSVVPWLISLAMLLFVGHAF